MEDDVEDTTPPSRSRRQWLIMAAAVGAAVAAVVLILFQPWKLWVDDKVDEAAPAGAVAVTATPVRTGAPPTSDAPAPATTGGGAAPAGPAVTTGPSTAAPTTGAPPTTVPPTTSPPIPVGGEFVGIDHGTSGTVVLLQDPAGTRFVRLENLDTSNGPDLFVYLSTNPPDGPEGQFDDDFVNLGRLQGNVGSSNYEIPADTDVARYASVVIWCDRFNSAFGAAPLG